MKYCDILNHRKPCTKQHIYDLVGTHGAKAYAVQVGDRVYPDEGRMSFVVEKREYETATGVVTLHGPGGFTWKIGAAKMVRLGAC